MLSFEGVLEGIERHILYRKMQIKDASKAAAEEAAFLSNAKGKEFDPVKYEKKKGLQRYCT